MRKTVRATGRVLDEVHRPERLLRRLVQRAGFRIVGRYERSTVDLARFEPVSDLLVFELAPADKPGTTLLVKACAMEAGTIGVQVRHLVSALEQPRGFAEILLVLDNREDGFLRQHGPGDSHRLRREADLLVAEGWVDRIVQGPSDGAEAQAINERWLGVPSSATHAASGAQLASTLAGFDECRTPFLLHTDADIMVGRRDPDHDYLGEMVDVLSRSGDAVTAGFNIYHAGDIFWSAAGDRGPWRVESRIGLLHMRRLHAMLPLPGKAEGDRPRLAWHRTLDLAVRTGAASSWRGGDHRTFFVHPPNDRKHDKNEWFSALDRIESGSVPPVQLDQVEWTGDARAWTMPERNEPFVFVIAGRNVPPERFRRCLHSVLRQRRTDWGAVVINDASRPAWSAEIAGICRPYRDRVTLVRRRRRVGLLANTVEAVRNRCADPTTVIVTLDADDCLIGDSVLCELAACYADGADVTVGSMLRTDKHHHYPVDFEAPRRSRGGNVWQHLRSFRKALFDGVPDEALRIDGQYVELANDWAYMLPIVELADRPVHIEQPLYLYERSTDISGALRSEREAVISYLVSRGRA